MDSQATDRISQGRECISCGGVADSKEHVVPQWLTRELREVAASVTSNRKLESNAGNGSLIELSGNALMRMSVKHLCAACNNGKFSQFEQELKPFLSKLSSGEDAYLTSEEDCRRLTGWAVKTMTFALLTSRQIDDERRRWLHTVVSKQMASAGSSLYLARTNEADPGFSLRLWEDSVTPLTSPQGGFPGDMWLMLTLHLGQMYLLLSWTDGIQGPLHGLRIGGNALQKVWWMPESIPLSSANSKIVDRPTLDSIEDFLRRDPRKGLSQVPGWKGSLPQGGHEIWVDG